MELGGKIMPKFICDRLLLRLLGEELKQQKHSFVDSDHWSGVDQWCKLTNQQIPKFIDQNIAPCINQIRARLNRRDRIFI